MSASVTCPNGCDLKGLEIPRVYLGAGYYGPWSPEDGPRYYSRLVGVEVPGVYDGVLHWQCPDCGAAWHRWYGDGPYNYVRPMAQPYIDRANVSATQSRGSA